MGLYTKHVFTDIHNQVTVIRERLLTSNRSKIPSLKAAELRNKLMILQRKTLESVAVETGHSLCLMLFC